VFLWNAATRNVALESRDAKNGYLSQPSQGPATSSRGNYVAFESTTATGDQGLPALSRAEVAPRVSAHAAV
jgi:hypothetical protein